MEAPIRTTTEPPYIPYLTREDPPGNHPDSKTGGEMLDPGAGAPDLGSISLRLSAASTQGGHIEEMIAPSCCTLVAAEQTSTVSGAESVGHSPAVRVDQPRSLGMMSLQMGVSFRDESRHGKIPY